MYNVLIGICCGGTIHAETVTSLIAAMNTLADKNVGVAVSVQVGGYKPYNCNRLVKEAQDGGFTHMMFIDADMVFPSSGIMRLLDNDKDIVGANYNQRGNPSAGDPKTSVVKMADDTGRLIATDHVPGQLFKCAGLGLGFTLMKMSVFEILNKPYFRDFEAADGDHHTEDIEFCEKARAAGLEVWCNPTIKMGHIGSYLY